MKIYISGKMGDTLSRETIDKFEQKRRELEAAGHTVMNPASAEWQDRLEKGYRGYAEIFKTPGDTKRRYVMQSDISELSGCEAIYMLPDWLDSPGAKAEHAFARAVGMEVIYDEDLYRSG